MPRHTADQGRLHWRAPIDLQGRARELRREMTPAELTLWQSIRNGQLGGAHFRKQHAVGQYVVDFICIRAKLIVELDGDTHAEPAQIARDAKRTHWLEEQKQYRVLRFANADVYSSLEAVVLQIAEALRESR
jgi:5-methyltetrahydrofolate--homocysteine methyltransferase